MARTRYLSFNGKVVPWEDAKIHALAPGVKCGAGVFEGIRGYWMRVMRYDQQVEVGRGQTECQQAKPCLLAGR